MRGLKYLKKNIHLHTHNGEIKNYIDINLMSKN